MGKELFSFDSTDLVGMRKIMEEYGDSTSPFFGTNSEDEDIMISVFHDRIVVDTYQSNGWLRQNIYDWDGTSEELFQGRWDMPQEGGYSPPTHEEIFDMGFEAGRNAAKREQQQAPIQGFNQGQTM